MIPLPSGDLRFNCGTWAVPSLCLPAVAHAMLQALPVDFFDSCFLGQKLSTTYFDTPGFALRKARRSKDRYLTLRVRCYGDGPGGETYALSAKTEREKFRREIEPDVAHLLLAGGMSPAGLLPAHLQARLLELAGDDVPVPVVRVGCRRYAVEDDADRFSLDVGVHTDTGLSLPFHVLEWKSFDPDGGPPGRLLAVGLRPIKLSKFLWATSSK